MFDQQQIAECIERSQKMTQALMADVDIEGAR